MGWLPTAKGISGCPGSQSPGSCEFLPGQRRRNRKCKYVQEPGEATGYRPQFHWDSTQGGRGRQAGQARMACAAKGPTLGSRRPLLDAPPPKRGKSRWAELLNPPTPLLPRVGGKTRPEWTLTSRTSDEFLLEIWQSDCRTEKRTAETRLKAGETQLPETQTGQGKGPQRPLL